MRYQLYSGVTYYANGGAHDLDRASDNAEELLSLISYKVEGTRVKKINQEAPHPIIDKGTVRLDIIEQGISWVAWFITIEGETQEVDWWHIYDSQAGEILYGSLAQAFNASDLKGPFEKALLSQEIKRIE